MRSEIGLSFFSSLLLCLGLRESLLFPRFLLKNFTLFLLAKNCERDLEREGNLLEIGGEPLDSSYFDGVRLRLRRKHIDSKPVSDRVLPTEVDRTRKARHPQNIQISGDITVATNTNEQRSESPHVEYHVRRAEIQSGFMHACAPSPSPCSSETVLVIKGILLIRPVVAVTQWISEIERPTIMRNGSAPSLYESILCCVRRSIFTLFKASTNMSSQTLNSAACHRSQNRGFKLSDDVVDT
ncbi:hypothetical protein VNO77_03370 [Canavalia gladiata]|uniref:Uncharacterized protein n=1 Tax=Canavalia gladiata TaxID=3824 RepID=A0AAN9MUM2_CANGL